MKKLIKIFCLLMFIMLVFGITTSKALEVTKDTTSTELIDALVSGESLLIKNSTMTNNPWIFCREKGAYLREDFSTYDLDKQVVYPDIDKDGNGYAIAYILGYGKKAGYQKSDIQRAFWKILGYTNGYSMTDEANELYNFATQYQKFKKDSEGKDITINTENAKTNSEGNLLIYGPIKITYSYTGYTYTKSDETTNTVHFGGFDLDFYTSDNQKVTTGIVELCSKNGSTYTNIDNNNDGKIRSASYSNKELYIRVNLNEIPQTSSLKMNIKYNNPTYTATLYQIEGEHTSYTEETIYCMECSERIQNARTEPYHINLFKLFEYEGKYWMYSPKNNVVEKVVDTTLDPKYDMDKIYFYPADEGVFSAFPETLDANDFDTNYMYCNLCKIGDEVLYSYKGAEGALIKHFNEKHLTTHKTTGMLMCALCKTSPLYIDESNFLSHIKYCTNLKGLFYEGIKTKFTIKSITYHEFTGCTEMVQVTDTESVECGENYKFSGTGHSQNLSVLSSYSYEEPSEKTIEIQLTTTIAVTKNWDDYGNDYEIRPETIAFNVFRSADGTNWEKLIENRDYKVEWTSKEANTWKAIINNLVMMDNEGKVYHFKVEEHAQKDYIVTYKSGNYTDCRVENTDNKSITITNTLSTIDISGYVWLDGQTGIKPAVPNNGIKDDTEKGMEGIAVYLYHKNPTSGTISKVAETITDENGHYEFTEQEIGYYYVQFEYDGINYEDTIKVENGSSKAYETETNRNSFNNRFKTITYGKSNDGTVLNYNYSNGKSSLITTENGKVKTEFQMFAETEQILFNSDVHDINLGLVKRGTDIALSTDVSNAEVDINGQKTTYTYNAAENTIEIGNGQTSEKTSYNLNLYTSDYYYRIRDYVSSDSFIQNDYINEEGPEGVTTGEELKVFVTYELNLQNQSTETTRINEVKYIFDEKYTFKQIIDSSYVTTISGNTITINLNGLSLGEGETKTLYLLFEVNNNEGLTLGNFSNKAEITSYSTDKGLIDTDSQPGNFVNSNQVEDDNDTAGGLTIKTEDTFVRKITGKVFDEENQNVNDVIVQLIELKTVNGKAYEYIWQETLSGTGKGLRLNAKGTALEEYTYTKNDGTYEFIGVIPGDYIVRFIYGDGSTYEMTGNIVKYNGQDYKSTKDSNYNSEWYNSSSYTEGASVARDNEARRLETIAYSVNIDVEKGLLLKLLDNKELNLTEKETLISIYNKYNDIYGTSDVTYTNIVELSDEVIEGIRKVLLLKEVLPNTWMCAETSKIKVAVDTENITNTSTETIVNGINKVYVEEIPNINLGLELRPSTKIELEKYITGFKLTAANGQTLVNAYIDVNEYLNDPINISNKVQGIRDNVTILDTVWQYEIAPTDINTIVDGASLEFEYTLVVKNTSVSDYISTELSEAYKNSSIADYATLLTSKANEIKGYMKEGTYKTEIGKAIGNSYYVGGTGTGKVLTEITNIRDYINNDLVFITSGGDVAVDEDASHTYRILRDDYSIQDATINTILKTTKTTGKMDNDGTAVIYTVTLGKNPISSTGNVNFENYIAEVMSYTNAAGRRSMIMTPGNAEIIDHEHREGKTHEIDEADTARIQIGAATGENAKTNYIIITAVIAGIVVIAAGAFVVKKYVIK